MQRRLLSAAIPASSLKSTVVAAMACAAVCVTSVSSAHAAEPEDYVTYRKAVLSTFGGHMKAMSTYLKTGVEVDDQVATHASAISAMSLTLPQAFPEGTADIGETRALPKAWEEFEMFSAGFTATQEAAAALAQAAVEGASKQEIGGLLGKLGGTCKECHDTYRAETN